MKKILLSVAIAAVAMVSCSNDETTSINEGSAINFRVAVPKAGTRGTATTTTSISEFKVTAVPSSSASETANFFSNLPVTKSSGTWATGAVYYWPTYGLDFFAYSPGSLSSSVSISKGTGNQKLTDFEPKTTVSLQEDVVVAFNTGTKTSNGSTGVPLLFQHALSQIEVKAAKDVSGTNIKIEVKGVKIAKVPSKATFAFPITAGSGTTKLDKSLWTAPTDAQSYSIEGVTAIELDNTYKSIMFDDGNFMLIPQQLTAWSGGTSANGTYLAVYCRISQSNGAGGYTVLFPEGTSDGTFGYSAVPIATEWLPGYKYIYNLKFLPGGGKTDPENPGGGEEILDAPIFFTVDVQDWEDATGIPNINM